VEAPNPLTAEVEEFLDAMRAERGASVHTVSAYRRDLGEAAQFFAPAMGWAELTPALFLAYEAWLGPRYAPRSARRKVSALRSFFRWRRRRVRAGLELPEVTPFRTPPELPKALARAALEALLEQPDLSTPDGVRDRALMELIYGCGLRISEALGLDVSDVAAGDEALRVTGKRGKVRVVPVPAGTAVWLGRYREAARPRMVQRAEAAVFLGARGGRLRRETAYARLRRYAEAVRLDGVSPHTLRHTYAVHLLQGGADLRAVQELLGHASPATTQVYTRLDTEEVRRRYARAHPRR
jgi:integrase/recombinase XerD